MQESLKPIVKTCVRCGKEFHCFHHTMDKCWCTNYQVSNENLKVLKEKYSNCLCEECLKLYATAKDTK